MKRYVMLITFTIVAIIGIFIAGAAIQNSYLLVSTVKLYDSTAESTVICSGIVELSGASKVTTPISGTVQKIFVSEGEKVASGQVLLSIRPLSAYYSSSSSYTASQLYSAYLNGRSDLTSSASSGNISVDSSDYMIRANDSGIIGSLSDLNVGSYVISDTTVAVIRKNSGVQIRMTVDETQISEIKTGQSAEITGVGFRNSVYHGTIESISSEAKQIVTTTGQRKR